MGNSNFKPKKSLADCLLVLPGALVAGAGAAALLPVPAEEGRAEDGGDGGHVAPIAVAATVATAAPRGRRGRRRCDVQRLEALLQSPQSISVFLSNDRLHGGTTE